MSQRTPSSWDDVFRIAFFFAAYGFATWALWSLVAWVGRVQALLEKAQ